MSDKGLSYRARKALTVHIGEEAGTEISDLIASLCAEIAELRRTKVNVTAIAPAGQPHDKLSNQSVQRSSYGK